MPFSHKHSCDVYDLFNGWFRLMGYRFQGFLTKDAEVAEKAKALWPCCKVKALSEQAVGFIIRYPDEDDLALDSPEQDYDEIERQILSVETGVIVLSRSFPKQCLIFVQVECFGGVCEHTGFHLKNGIKTKVYDEEPDDNLQDILQPLEVNWASGTYFNAFERAFFDD